MLIIGMYGYAGPAGGPRTSAPAPHGAVAAVRRPNRPGPGPRSLAHHTSSAAPLAVAYRRTPP